MYVVKSAPTLCRVNSERYVETFRAAGVDGETLLDLDEDVLAATEELKVDRVTGDGCDWSASLRV